MSARTEPAAPEADPGFDLNCAAEVLGWSVALYKAIESATTRGDTEQARALAQLGGYLSDMWWSNTRQAAIGAERVAG